jgi:dolichol-phosphate mannosyltransferase
MPQSLVIIPTYNERENIAAIIEAVMSLNEGFHVLVVDDHSSDGTQQDVEALMATRFPERLFLEKRSGKLGLGTAYIHGFKWALQRNYDFIFEMDADFSHNPNDLPVLLHACMNDADMAIGSRYIKGITVVNWPLGRLLISFFASLYVRLITGMPVHDSTAGFVCYRRKVLETIPLDKIKFTGYAFQIEMKFMTWTRKFRLKEIPIIFKDREKGKSKMSAGIFNEALFGVIQMKLKSLFSRE